MRRPVAARRKKIVEEAESLSRGHAPRHHIFAPHSILEFCLAFEDKHPMAGSRQLVSERRARESTANDDCVVTHDLAPVE